MSKSHDVVKTITLAKVIIEIINTIKEADKDMFSRPQKILCNRRNVTV